MLRRTGDADADAAAAAIERAVPVLAAVCPLDRPGALATLAALRLQQRRPAEALAAAEDGLARYRSMGACGMFRGAFLRLAHAEALAASGRTADARAAIAEARRCVLANADRVPEPAVRARFLGEVAENRRIFALAGDWLADRAPPA